VFLDESGVTTAMTRSYAYALIGERAPGQVPRNRGQVLTVIGAMRANGELALATIDAATSKDVFEAYVEQILVPFLRPGDIVVCDNLGAHKSKEARWLIEQAGAYVHWQPPYTPEVNAIELFWGWMKDRLRSDEPRGRLELDRAIADAADSLTPEIASAWVRHSGYLAQRT
jgi:transposase